MTVWVKFQIESRFSIELYGNSKLSMTSCPQGKHYSPKKRGILDPFHHHLGRIHKSDPSWPLTSNDLESKFKWLKMSSGSFLSEPNQSILKIWPQVDLWDWMTLKVSSIYSELKHRPSRHEQTTDPVQLKLCLSHKRRLASNADVGFYCVNIMTTSFSSPERIVWTIMSGIITVTRLMSSLGIKDHRIYLWFIHTLYAKRTRWNYIYIYFIAKKTASF